MISLASKQNTENDLKIAIVLHKELANVSQHEASPWFLYSYNYKQKLDLVLESAVNQFNLCSEEQYALIIGSENNENKELEQIRYLSDDNCHEIANGNVLYVYHSPTVIVKNFLSQMSTTNDVLERIPVLEKILSHSNDPVFVEEFNKQNGFKWLINGIHNDQFQNAELCYALDIFYHSMEHDIIHWTTIEKSFLEKITHLTMSSKNEIGDVEKKILILSLSILESSVINCPGKFIQEIEKQLPLPNLYSLLKYDRHPEIQQNVLALINSMAQRTDINKRKAMLATLNSRQFKDMILQYIVNKNMEIDKSLSGSEITHQLYVLQTLLLKDHEERYNSGASPEQAKEKVLEIRNFYFMNVEPDGFESKAPGHLLRSQNSLGSGSSNSSFSVSSSDSSHYAEDFDKLGFGNMSEPWKLFYEPPGALVLHLLHYFAKFHTDAYVRFVIENSSMGNRQHDCSLINASFRLNNLVCEMLNVGRAARDEGKEFYPMLFDTDKPLEEFFAIGLSLFNRTWHEIHATSTDIDIVCDFLREKLSKTLENSSATHSFETFRKELSKITYVEINRRWNEERQKRDRQKEELPAIKELKKILEPEMFDIVRQHRLNYLIEGTRFDKYTQKGQRVKDKFWYCRLSTNHKTLLYGDCNEDCKNLDDILVNKFNISDIHSLVTGKDCPHMHDTKGKKSTTSLAFALISREDSVRNLCFVAPKADIFNYWIDGLNALLDKQMTSQEAIKDAEMLLDLDVKLRLLDVEGLTIPETMPELPPSPPNYDFAYKSSYIS